MKDKQNVIIPSIGIFLIFTFICGILYTLAVTGLSQLLFPRQANGSIIEVDGKKYGSELLGQYFTDEGHMWGRIMNVDISTYTDENGKKLMYGAPSNLSPASEEYGLLVKERADMLKKENPEMSEKAIPVDLVTCSGSGLDPHISLAAAMFQVPRIAGVKGMEQEEVEAIIKKCTDNPFLGLFGDKAVNVLKVNLMLDGILTEK